MVKENTGRDSSISFWYLFVTWIKVTHTILYLSTLVVLEGGFLSLLISFSTILYPLSLNCLLKYSVGNVSPVLWWNSFWRKYTSGELSWFRSRTSWTEDLTSFRRCIHLQLHVYSWCRRTFLVSTSFVTWQVLRLLLESNSSSSSIDVRSLLFFPYVCLRKMTDDILSYLLLFLMMSSLLFDDKRQQYMKWTRRKTL